MIKQKLVSMLRMLKLLPLADRVRFYAVWLKHTRSNRVFLDRHPNAVLPPRFLIYDAYGHVNYGAYA